jgi:hypothetical protein
VFFSKKSSFKFSPRPRGGVSAGSRGYAPKIAIDESANDGASRFVFLVSQGFSLGSLGLL